MPIYEYKCQECGETSEYRITSQSQVNSLVCKNCSSQNLRKLMSVPSIAIGRTAPAEHSCCGSPGSCSEPGHCCGHETR
jgi:putative FmdB family regulatory protein